MYAFRAIYPSNIRALRTSTEISPLGTEISIFRQGSGDRAVGGDQDLAAAALAAGVGEGLLDVLGYRRGGWWFWAREIKGFRAWDG